MAGNPSVKKREKERARQQHRREKDAKRLQRREEKATRDPVAEGEDPDIAGIVPGPQPLDPELVGIDPDSDDEPQ